MVLSMKRPKTSFASGVSSKFTQSRRKRKTRVTKRKAIRVTAIGKLRANTKTANRMIGV